MNTVTKTAVSYLKYNKARSVLICISIFLTTVLLTIIGTAAVGIIKGQNNNAGLQYGNFHGTYANVTPEQLAVMNQHREFIKTGLTQTIATAELDGADASLAFMDNNVCTMTNFQLIEGKMPESENEIAAQREFFEKLMVHPEIGDMVTVPYRIGGQGEILTRDFVISGFSQSNEQNDLFKTYKAFVSEAFYDVCIPKSQQTYIVCFKILGEESLNYTEMENKIYALAEELGIHKDYADPNNGYLIWSTDPGTEVIITCALIALMVVIFSVLIIYNIFYVGIIQKVQEFGKLRAIGATKRQLKGIVFREGMILALISIPFGVLVGYGLSVLGLDYFLYKSVSSLNQLELKYISPFNPIVILLVMGVSFLTVYLSMCKPMRLAANASPVEAMKYQGENYNPKKLRTGYDEVTLYRLGKSNISRHKKRTLTTIFTMGLSCVLFVVVANILSSMDAEFEARERYVEKGQFCLSLNASLNDHTYPENNLNHIQMENPLNDSLLEQIRAIDGVLDVQTKNVFLAQMDTEGFAEFGEGFMTIGVLGREDFQSRMKDLKRGTMDYDKLTRENGVIYTSEHFMDEHLLSLGDTVSFDLFDGDKKIPFQATVQGATSDSDNSFLMTEDTFKAFETEQILTCFVYVYCKPEMEPEVNKALESLVGDNDAVDYKALSAMVKNTEKELQIFKYPTYALLIVLGIIGFMNLANTLITSIITRKRELGILQAIGLTNKQLSRMLGLEGFVSIAGTLAVSLTLGNLFGYLAFLKLKETGMFGLNVYHFPFMELLIMALSLVLLQLILSLIMSRNIRKEALIDRIRYHE